MLTTLFGRVKGLLRRNAIDLELDEELQFHVEMETQKHIERGMSPGEARRVALRDLGGVTQTKEAVRDERSVWVDSLLQDLRYAWRSLRRAPGFTTIAVLTLALGIGLNTGLFGIVNAVLIRPLPFPHPEQLVSIGGVVMKNDFTTFDRKVFAVLAHYSVGSADLTDAGEPTRIPACSVSPVFFTVFGIRPALGRDFRRDEGADGVNDVAIISDGFWRRQFAARADVLGLQIQLNGKPHRIVGVGPSGFTFPGLTDVWLPSDFGRGQFYLYARSDEGDLTGGTFGRLRPGVSLDIARAAAKAGQRSFEDATRRPGSREGHSSVGLRPLQDLLVRNAKASLLMLFGAVGFVLLVASANVANMLYARGVRRRQELAIRTSLGAGRVRLARQLLTESLLLSFIGGVAGLLVAALVARVFVVLVPANFPGLSVDVASTIIDLRVFIFLVVVCLLAGVSGGLMSAGPRMWSHIRLTQAARTTAPASSPHRLRDGLIALQVTACLVLVVGAGLMTRTLALIQRADPGFDPEHATAMQLSLPVPRALSPKDAETHYIQQQKALEAELASIPGVAFFGTADQLPLDKGSGFGQFFKVEPPLDPPLPDRTAVTISVSPGYFAAMGIPILSGRAFTTQEAQADGPVAIVDETLARRYWPGTSAVGKRIQVASDWREVVGVVHTVPYDGPAASTQRGTEVQIYLPGPGQFFVFRSTIAPERLVSEVRLRAHKVDRYAVVTRVRTMRDQVEASEASPRSLAALLASFGILALLLAGVGIYGVVAYVVAERTHEIGVRVALGASSGHVVWMAVRQAVGPLMAGLCLGVPIALAGGRVVKAFLFGTVPAEPMVFVLAFVTTAACGLAAAYIPARRATRVDPTVALRCD